MEQKIEQKVIKKYILVENPITQVDLIIGLLGSTALIGLMLKSYLITLLLIFGIWITSLKRVQDSVNFKKIEIK